MHLLLILALCLYTTALSAAPMTLVPAGQSGHHGRTPPAFELHNGADADVHFWQSDLQKQPLNPENGRVTLRRPAGLDGYHALVAEKRSADRLESLVHYRYFNGKPSGHSPAELLAIPKTPLEIVPDPLPREHYRYYSDTQWAFVVRFEGEPLPGVAVTLNSGNGSVAQALSNAQGRVMFRLPEDFRDIRAGRRANRPAPFTLSTEWKNQGMRYHSQLYAMYHVNPAHWQSMGWGVAVIVLGLLTGGWLGRRGLGGQAGMSGKSARGN